MDSDKDQIKQKAEEQARLEEKNKEGRIAASLDKEEEADKLKEAKNREEEPFYITAQKAKKKETKEEEKPEPKWAICRGDVCFPVKMNGAEAKDYCNKANELLESDNPNDKAIAEKAWQALRDGKETESRNLIETGIQAKRDRECAMDGLQKPADTISNPLQNIYFDILAQKNEAKKSEASPTDEKKLDSDPESRKPR